MLTQQRKLHRTIIMIVSMSNNNIVVLYNYLFTTTSLHIMPNADRETERNGHGSYSPSVTLSLNKEIKKHIGRQRDRQRERISKDRTWGRDMKGRHIERQTKSLITDECQIFKQLMLITFWSLHMFTALWLNTTLLFVCLFTVSKGQGTGCQVEEKYTHQVASLMYWCKTVEMCLGCQPRISNIQASQAWEV